MEITEVRVILTSKGSLKAFASIALDGCFLVKGLKVIKGTKGLFVAMPSRRLRDGSFKDIARPTDNKTRSTIQEKVLWGYQKALATQEAPAPSKTVEKLATTEKSSTAKEKTKEEK